MDVAQVTAVAVVPAAVPHRLDQHDAAPSAVTNHGYLTAGDRALLHAATAGDLADRGTGPLATHIAADRQTGVLAPGQPVTLAYLRDKAIRFEDTPHPMPPLLFARALVYLTGRGGHAPVDVTA